MASTDITDFDQRPETARGRAMHRLLLEIHSHIRRDLELVQELAAAVADGLGAEELHRELRSLKRGGVLWQLQLGCLRYCRFVHLHHHAEDAHLFSEVREANPAIDPVVDRLEAEHRRVSDDLDAVEAAARALEHDGDSGTRRAVVDALGVLERNLLAHLDYEELELAPTIRRLP